MSHATRPILDPPKNKLGPNYYGGHTRDQDLWQLYTHPITHFYETRYM